MNTAREFANKMVHSLNLKSIMASKNADDSPDAIERVDLRGRACAYADAAVMVLEMIEAEEAK